MHNISCSHYISVLTPLVEWQKGHPVCKKKTCCIHFQRFSLGDPGVPLDKQKLKVENMEPIKQVTDTIW